MNNITIGILAGMGPRSTSPFLELVLDECQKQYVAQHDIDYPHIIVYSLPTPFYIDRETDEEALKQSIKEGIERLNRCEVDLIGIPCNSAHAYFNEIVENVDVPVLNIIDETLKKIQRDSKISLFATEMTRRSELYQEGIAEKSCTYYFEAHWQETINQVILRIKNQATIDETRLLWNALIDEAVKTSVEKIIIACTDLNVVVDYDDKRIEFIDSSQSLASGLVLQYLQMTGRRYITSQQK